MQDQGHNQSHYQSQGYNHNSYNQHGNRGKKHKYAYTNTNKINTVYNAKNLSWQGIHNAITVEQNRELFDTDLIVPGNSAYDETTRICIQVNTNCMTELLLLDNTKVLILFDTGSTVNLISESVTKSNEYLSGLSILNYPEH